MEEHETKESVKMENKALQNMKKQQLISLIGDLTNGIQKQHDETKKLTSEIQTQHDNINNLFTETKKQRDEAKRLVTETQAQHDNVNNLSNETKKQRDEAKRLVTETQAQHDNVNNLSNETKKQYDEVKKLTAEVQEKHRETNKLFDKIKGLYDGASIIIKEKNKKLTELIEKINGLLPGATSAGLASSYHEGWQEKNTKLYWIGFIVSLFILVTGYFFLIYRPQDIKLLDVFVRTIVGAPLVWLAWYCQKSISQTNRIKEEYHHKQRIMSVFEGFSKQIDELTKDNPEENKTKKLDLISVIINAIRKNPSEILDPSETFLDSLKNMKRSNQNQEEENESSSKDD